MHEISKRQVIDLVIEVAARGTPSAANKLLKVAKTFFAWCLGKAILELSPAKGVSAPAKEKARDRVLDDDELAQIIIAARQINGPYGGIVELLGLTGQRREEVANLGRARPCPSNLDPSRDPQQKRQAAYRTPVA